MGCKFGHVTPLIRGEQNPRDPPSGVPRQVKNHNRISPSIYGKHLGSIQRTRMISVIVKSASGAN